jgi:hypothetical protein
MILTDYVGQGRLTTFLRKHLTLEGLPFTEKTTFWTEKTTFTVRATCCEIHDLDCRITHALEGLGYATAA